MISHLSGKIVFRGEKFVVIDVSGVGYKVFVSPDSLRQMGKGTDTSVWSHLSVRETSLELYGFVEYAELEFFEMLIQISGIGPKSALGVLSVAPLDTLKNAVSSGDTSYLIKVSGIGKKVAEKIVLELRDKLGALEGVEGGSVILKEEGDVLDALQSLGYSLREARDALKQIPETATDTNSRIKEALKLLGK
jgi:Holliday junction DNA helicase RuvA